MNQSSERQRIFAREYATKRVSAGKAYAVAYKREVDNTAYVEGHKLLKKPKIQNSIEKIRKNLDKYASEAFERNVALSKDKKVNPSVRSKINTEISQLGGLVTVQKIETKDTTYTGLNDNKGYEDILSQAYNKVQKKK